MQKNIDLIVHRLHSAYRIHLTKPLKDPVLGWSDTPYSGRIAAIGPMRGQEMWVPAPDASKRPYFVIEGGGEAPIWSAATAVEIDAVENFRDMGGYRTQAGRTVKWGRFFRCGAVSGMESPETEVYRNMRIRSIFDYRAEGEAKKRPDVYGHETAYHLVPGIAATGDAKDGLSDMDMEAQLRRIHTAEDAERLYRQFVSLYGTLPFRNPAYEAMFAALDSEDAAPMIQHCSAGKDRTGIGCALLLLALGVDEETVLEDYLLSAVFRAPDNRRYLAKMAEMGAGEHALSVMGKMLTVTRDMLAFSFERILRRYPSHEAFLAAEYGVTPARRDAWRRMHTV